MAKYEYKWRYMYESRTEQAARFFYRLPVATVQPAWRAPGRSGPSAAVTSDGGRLGMD